jgi:hypothetical protein
VLPLETFDLTRAEAAKEVQGCSDVCEEPRWFGLRDLEEARLVIVEGKDRTALRCHRRESVSDPYSVTMSCCCSSAAAERQFGGKRATKDLAKYRTKGPGLTARLLLAGIAKAGPPYGWLLDVGSGVGALMFELLERGLTEAVGVALAGGRP